MQLITFSFPLSVYDKKIKSRFTITKFSLIKLYLHLVTKLYLYA
jgi:hypothetical protein